MKTNIALIGFMGVGKSAVGKLLAQKTGKKLIEVDALIIQKAGKTIPQIFHEGEIAFREMEIAVIKEVAAGKNQIIACGGGAALNKINIDRLKLNSVIIWLTATPSVILKRTSSDQTARPLLNNKDKLSDIRILLKYRKPYYKGAADIVIDTSRSNIEAVVEEIINQLKENANIN